MNPKHPTYTEYKEGTFIVKSTQTGMYTYMSEYLGMGDLEYSTDHNQIARIISEYSLKDSDLDWHITGANQVAAFIEA